MKSRALVLVVAVVLMSVSAFADEYKFRIRNTTDKKITKILVSEDGVEFGFFNIGKGIEPGKTANLVWEYVNQRRELPTAFQGGLRERRRVGGATI